VGGSTTISGASVDFSKTTLAGMGAVLNISAGSLNLGDRSPTVATLNLSGGELLGSGTLTAGELNWSDGLMGGSGMTVVNTTLNFNGTTPLILDQRTLVNHGVADWHNTGYLYLTNDAVVRNASGATMNLNSAVSFIIYGTGTLENDGTLNFSKGRMDLTAFHQNAGAVFNLSINGKTPGDDFGQVRTRTAALNGAINIDFPSYAPVAGENFAIMIYTTTPTSQFASVQVTDSLPSKNWDWLLAYQPTELLLSAGNFFLYLPVVVK
jgi:hypothetical protein